MESVTGCEDTHSCSFVARAKDRPLKYSRNLQWKSRRRKKDVPISKRSQGTAPGMMIRLGVSTERGFDKCRRSVGTGDMVSTLPAISGTDNHDYIVVI